jgi:RNA 2',3'-cyclic 3'-phosphodiesterase
MSNLFYGFEISNPGVVANILGTVEDIRGLVPRATWTSPEKLHVTVLFLGEIPVEGADQLLQKACLSRSPFSVTMKGAGVFMGRPGPRVLYAEMSRNTHHIQGLHTALGGKGRMTPHLTLAKLENKGDAAMEFNVLAKQLVNHEFGTSLVSSVKLYRTQGSGLPYEVVAVHRLLG